MGKRSSGFARIARDCYRTPLEAVGPLIPHLPADLGYIEPFAGDGALIEHLGNQVPTWLLFDADWVHTKQAIPFLPMLRKIVSIGRVRWFPESRMTGKDNCAWHLFHAGPDSGCEFVGRQS